MCHSRLPAGRQACRVCHSPDASGFVPKAFGMKKDAGQASMTAGRRIADLSTGRQASRNDKYVPNDVVS